MAVNRWASLSLCLLVLAIAVLRSVEEDVDGDRGHHHGDQFRPHFPHSLSAESATLTSETVKLVHTSTRTPSSVKPSLPRDSGTPSSVKLFPPQKSGAPSSVKPSLPRDSGTPSSVKPFPPQKSGTPSSVEPSLPRESGTPSSVKLSPPRESGTQNSRTPSSLTSSSPPQLTKSLEGGEATHLPDHVTSHNLTPSSSPSPVNHVTSHDLAPSSSRSSSSSRSTLTSKDHVTSHDGVKSSLSSSTRSTLTSGRDHVTSHDFTPSSSMRNTLTSSVNDLPSILVGAMSASSMMSHDSTFTEPVTELEIVPSVSDTNFRPTTSVPSRTESSSNLVSERATIHSSDSMASKRLTTISTSSSVQTDVISSHSLPSESIVHSNSAHTSNSLRSIPESRSSQSLDVISVSVSPVSSPVSPTVPRGTGFNFKLVLYVVPPLGALVLCVVCVTTALCCRRYRRIYRFRQQLVPLTDMDGSEDSDEDSLDDEPTFHVNSSLSARPILAFEED